MSKRKKSSKKGLPATSLPVLRTNAAGIDIGSRSHYVAGPVPEDNSINVKEFGTTTPELHDLAEWLLEQEVETVAMESTNVYWIPVFEVLESYGFEVVLANARYINKVPGRKTDVLDCQWIQLLHSCGLIRGSFRPSAAICALRTIKRQMANLVEQRTKAVQWMQKSLDQMNIRVHHAVSELTGQTGLRIVQAIVDGERDVYKLATLKDRRCKKSIDEIAAHLTGTWREEHLFNLKMALELFQKMNEMIQIYEQRILDEIEALHPPERADEPVPAHPNINKERAIKYRGEHKTREALWRLTGLDLTRIDGISGGAALVVITEVGFDMSSFPTEKDFVSWLRLSPKHGVTGGKQIQAKKKNAMGATRIASALRMASLSLKQSKTALGAYFRRLARRKDASVAIFATARKLATLIYRMLRYGQEYVDMGEQAFEKQFEERKLKGMKSSLASMGYMIVPIEEDFQVSG